MVRVAARQTVLAVVWMFIQSTSARSAEAALLEHKVYKLTGQAGWAQLALDAKAHRLYITRDTFLSVFDLDKDTEQLVHLGTQGAAGIAIDAETGRGFVTGSRSDDFIVFDLKTFKVLAKVKVGKKPLAVVFEPWAKRVVVFNADSYSATVMAADTLKVLGTITLSGRPTSAVSNGVGKIFVNIGDKNELSALDPVGLKIKSTWPIPGCKEPSGLAMDVDQHRLFSACRNHKLVVIDAESGRQVVTLPIGAEAETVAYEPTTGSIYTANDGTLTVLHMQNPEKYEVVGTIATRPGSCYAAIDPTSRRVYVPAARLVPAKRSAVDSPRRFVPPMQLLELEPPPSK